MNKRFKRFASAFIASVAVMSTTIPVMAEPANVYVNFISAGQVVGKTVPAGSNVVAPSVPVVGGFTFCGFDKSLRNVTTNTTYTAVYVSNSLGDAAIAAKKASLPTPAISATTVANPNVATPAIMPALPATATVANSAQPLTASQAATASAAIAASQANAAANPAIAAAAADIAKQQAANQNAALQAAALLAAQQKAAADAATTATATATTPQATVPAVVPTPGVPSWVVGLEGVSQQGAITAYNYLKNTKGMDDATIQANWGGLMHHYAGHGTAGW